MDDRRQLPSLLSQTGVTWSTDSDYSQTDAIALTSIWQRFGIDMQEEALKMWVYGIAASIVLGLYEMFTSYYPVDGPTKPSRSKGVVDAKAASGDRGTTAGALGSSTRGKEGRSVEKENEQSSEPAERRRIVKQLVVDCCDILIPSAAVGWIPLDTMAVGMAGAMSASVSLSALWMKAARRVS